MLWRSSSPRPDSLDALRRVVEHPDDPEATPPQPVRVAVLAPRRTLRRRPRETPRPANEPLPSHRRPDKAAQTVITTTLGTEPAETPHAVPQAVMKVAPTAPAPRRSRAPRSSQQVTITPPPVPAPTVPEAPASEPPASEPATSEPPASEPPASEAAAERRSRFLGHVGGFLTMAEQASQTGRASLDTPIAPPPARPAPTHRALSAGQVLAAMLACLGCWALIDAAALAHSAETSHLGTRRTVALDVLHPLARASEWLGLDRVDREADDLLGHHHPVADPVVLPPTVSTKTPPVTVPGARPVAHPTPSTTAAPKALAPLPIPTAANPLRVLEVGDSLGLTFGQSLATKLDATGLVQTTVDAREGTGLARPDSFNWPAQLRADIVRFHPEVIFASFGGNDDQDVQVNGKYIAFGSPAWDSIYEQRVVQLASAAWDADAYLVYSGLPVMRSSGLTQRLQVVMNLTKQALAGHPGVLFVDNMATLATASGDYTDTLRDSSGNAVIVRQPDGIHETPQGADRLVDKAIAAMNAGWHTHL